MATMLSSILPKPIHQEEAVEDQHSHVQRQYQQSRQAQVSQKAALNKAAAKGQPKAQAAVAANAAAAPSTSTALVSSKPPPYGSRKGWVPSKPEDYGDGGA